ncbi:MAG: hypothetical protein CMJ36_02995 [Phycisphaerae bacterium]|nr:hypothetical protein [Phycisphaerae bacterium]
MNDHEDQHEGDLSIYRQWADSLDSGGATVDPLDLAAWLDGTLDDEARDALESRLALDASSRELVVDLASIHSDEASPKLIDRLVSIPEGEHTLLFEAHAPRVAHRAWWTSSGIAAALALAALGFWAGQLAATDAEQLEQRFLAAATFDVFDGATDMNAFDEAIVNMDWKNEVTP